MELDRQVLLEEGEVRVRGEDGYLVPNRNGTDEKIGIRALNPFSAANIIEFRSGLVIVGGQLEIRKRAEMIPKLRELGMAFDS